MNCEIRVEKGGWYGKVNCLLHVSNFRCLRRGEDLWMGGVLCRHFCYGATLFVAEELLVPQFNVSLLRFSASYLRFGDVSCFGCVGGSFPSSRPPSQIIGSWILTCPMLLSIPKRESRMRSIPSVKPLS